MQHPLEEGRWLTPRGAAAPFQVFQSPFWSYNNIALVSGDEACLFDPGARPIDLDVISSAARQGGRHIAHVVVTHSHHDHIRAWNHFVGARIWLPLAVQDKPEQAKQRDLEFKHAIDQRLKVVDPDFVYPHSDDAFASRASFSVGELEVDLRFLPGHSLCTSVAFVPQLRTLVSADYLVSPGMPYCRWQPHEFESAMTRLREWCVELEIEQVWPAHNSPITGHAAVLAAIDEERSYFKYLRELVRELLATGLDPNTVTRQAAQAMRERRGDLEGVRQRQDGDNARRVVVEESTEQVPPLKPSDAGDRG